MNPQQNYGLESERVSRITQRTLLILAFFIFAALIVSCDAVTSGGPPRVVDAFEIEPVFREFYSQMGGVDLLGQGISPFFSAGNSRYQYTVNALLMHDPASPANARIHLAPLGLDMGITEPPVPKPEVTDGRWVEGHIISKEFLPLYERLGGLRFVGRPITEVHYNPERGRYEQFFENLGFYRMELDGPDEVYLMAYGVWKCDASCRQPNVLNNGVDLPFRTGKPFMETVSRLGADFTGFALSEPYITPDGYTEQVFEKVVLIIAPSNPGRVFLRSITQGVGILPDPPADSAEPKTGMVFFRTQGEKGYYVPQYFLDYLAQHGGMDVSGLPISGLNQIKDGIYRQCFTNLCLDVSQDAFGSFRVIPAPLGYTYRQLAVQPVVTPPIIQPALPSEAQPEVPQEPPLPTQEESLPEVQQANPTDNSSFREVSIQVWESYPMVGPDQSQEIGVSVFENNVPLNMVEPDLVLTLPDGSQQTYYMLPTGDDGQTRQQVDPIGAPSGTLIPYQVCIFNPGGQKFCVKDSFLIWQNP